MRLYFPPFTVGWVTGLVVATYVCISALVIQVHEVLPSVPTSKHTNATLVDALDIAWSDLQTIAQRPHPYNSRENEVTRAYLLQRVQKLADQYPSVHVEDDLVSNATYVEAKRMAFYVEGSNILVKVTGRNASLPAVLFSAHLDSESTAPGATDDGMAIVSLLSLVEQFAKNPPLRTAIFNLNNGEEEGLCGSHVFFQHPWSKEPETFINMEGAGSGGRPILFRASTAQLVKAFQHTSRPHGTVISSDAYALGLIKSLTDFEVYATEGGLKGLDVSYYMNRDKYHTMGDTVSSLNGPRSLWTGLQLLSDVGYALTNMEANDDSGTKAVYWDVFGRKMVALSFDNFVRRLPRLAAFTTILVIGLNGLLWYQGLKFVPRLEWTHIPASLLSGIIASSLISTLYCKINPLIIYSSSYSVVTSIGAAIVLSMLLPLRLLYLRSSTNQSHFKLLAWTQYFIFMLAIQLGYIRILQKASFGGFYFLEWLYGAAAFGLVLETSSEMWRLRMSRNAQVNELEATSDVTQPLLETFNPLSEDGQQRYGRLTGNRPSHPDYLWIFQLAACAIPSITLVFPLVLVVASGLGQTIADGSAPVMVYAGITVLLFLCILPLVPFAHRISTRLFGIMALIFVVATLYNIVAFPFFKDRRVKFFFNQNLDLDTGRNTVELRGIQPYLRQALRSIPSANAPNASIVWSTDPVRGLGEVKWGGLMPTIAQLSPEPTESNLNALVTSTARRLDADTVVFTVRGKDTKSCIISFDQNVMDIRVRSPERDNKDGTTKLGPSIGISEDTVYSMPDNGVPVVTLLSRKWNAEFEVTVKWNSTAVALEGKGENAKFSWRSLLPFPRKRWPTYSGRIGCQWSDNQDGQLKALNELFTFLPEWATITSKRALLVADRAFSV